MDYQEHLSTIWVDIELLRDLEDVDDVVKMPTIIMMTGTGFVLVTY